MEIKNTVQIIRISVGSKASASREGLLAEYKRRGFGQVSLPARHFNDSLRLFVSSLEKSGGIETPAGQAKIVACPCQVSKADPFTAKIDLHLQVRGRDGNYLQIGTVYAQAKQGNPQEGQAWYSREDGERFLSGDVRDMLGSIQEQVDRFASRATDLDIRKSAQQALCGLFQFLPGCLLALGTEAQEQARKVAQVLRQEVDGKATIQAFTLDPDQSTVANMASVVEENLKKKIDDLTTRLFEGKVRDMVKFSTEVNGICDEFELFQQKANVRFSQEMQEAKDSLLISLVSFDGEI